MGSLFLLLGTSAVGKTTVGEAVAAICDVRYVYATGRKLELMAPGEKLNFFDQGRTYEINLAFFAELDPDEDVLVDTHATYPYGEGFVRLTPPTVYDRIGGIVFVEAPAVTVASRRLVRGRPLEATDIGSVTAWRT